ncbi:hypothetical protein J2S43_001294 [Catenuloplanes nepalensis]|uniref:Uncharacterized protein n=1 Tax=Catenuloplanes nepalensis TaxID=587533 RepID=A0ABT9MMZ7_9ACTN|nr:hypothetical protein [Catenuloplanes nepalensis]MDP9792782.1 hypothetical protein [Catenuloplanes nepalensis]
MTPPLGHRLAALAFPPGQRREELLDTLAESGERLGMREAADILWHGARARLGRPGNHLVVPFAMVAMLLGAFTVAVLATQLAWRFVPPLPDGERAAEIGNTVFPGIRVYGGGDVPDFVGEPDAEAGLVHGYVDYVIGEHTEATRAVADYTAGAHDRLAAAGWAVHPIAATEYGGHRFWAQRDGLVLQYEIWHHAGVPWYDSDGGAHYSLSRATPDRVWWAAPAGAPIGALVGFLLFGWVSRRTERAGGAVALLLLAYAFPLLGVLLFMTEAVRMWWRPDPAAPPVQPFWRPLFYDVSAFPTLLLMLLTAGALLLAALVPPFPLPRVRALITRHHRVLLGAAAVIVTGATVMAFTGGDGTCDPDGTPPPLTAAEIRRSRDARVIVDPRSTQDERNLLQAAIGRTGGSPAWRGNSDRGDTVATIGCMPADTLWFDVSYTTPGMYDRLVNEVSGLPGVLSVHRTA